MSQLLFFSPNRLTIIDLLTVQRRRKLIDLTTCTHFAAHIKYCSLSLNRVKKLLWRYILETHQSWKLHLTIVALLLNQKEYIYIYWWERNQIEYQTDLRLYSGEIKFNLFSTDWWTWFLSDEWYLRLIGSFCLTNREYCLKGIQNTYTFLILS